MPTDVNFNIPFNPGQQLGEQVSRGLMEGFDLAAKEKRDRQLFQFHQRELDLRQQTLDMDKLEKESVADRNTATAAQARMEKLHLMQQMTENENQKRMYSGQSAVSMREFLQQNGITEDGELTPSFNHAAPAPAEPSYSFHDSVGPRDRQVFGLLRREAQANVSKAAPHLFIPSAAPTSAALENNKNWIFHPDIPEAGRMVFMRLPPKDQEGVAAISNGKFQPAPEWTSGLSTQAASYASFIDNTLGNFAPEDKAAVARVIEQNISGDRSKISAAISKLSEQYADPKKQTYAEFRNQGMSPADAERATEKALPKQTTDEEERQFQKAVTEGTYKDNSADRLRFHQAWAVKPVQPGQSDARMDRSYQYNSTQLERIRTPIDQRSERLTRVTDAINQKDPQADSLIAPELLSVMAGGQGSGLRMNEAEISRIVGGRSNWERIQAAVNKWKPNDEALSITDSQRVQIQKLLTTVSDRVQQKQQILSDAENELLAAPSVSEHRRIVAETRQKLAAVDSGQTDQSGQKIPLGARPVRQGDKIIGYTTDGKTMIPAGAQ